MPAASSTAEPPELATELSSCKPAASCHPAGRPRCCAGGLARVCRAGRWGAAGATGPWARRKTIVTLAGVRTAGGIWAETDVDAELVLNADFVADAAPGYGTGRTALWCECGGATGFGAA